jgi:hydroxyacylglutathione hydrolase
MGGLMALEDELGDVLEKALRRACIRPEDLAIRSGVDLGKIRDALDYRYDLGCRELQAIARALSLNEVGLCALAQNRYPPPEPCGLPFCLKPLSMPYGVGVVNAYLVRLRGSEEAILFDSGCGSRELGRVWPPGIRRLLAHFVTHWDTDHVGAAGRVLGEFHPCGFYGPQGGAVRPQATLVGEGDRIEVGPFVVRVFSTPGHSCSHNSYLVGLADPPEAPQALIAGDLFFAGSIGGGFHCWTTLVHHAQRLWRTLPEETVVAPGHGPMTTIGHERRFNPFA